MPTEEIVRPSRETQWLKREQQPLFLRLDLWYPQCLCFSLLGKRLQLSEELDEINSIE
jgi:hypothetical protein